MADFKIKNKIIGLPYIQSNFTENANMDLALRNLGNPLYSMPKLILEPVIAKNTSVDQMVNAAGEVFNIKPQGSWDLYKKYCEASGIILPDDMKYLTVALSKVPSFDNTFSNTLSTNFIETLIDKYTPDELKLARNVQKQSNIRDVLSKAFSDKFSETSKTIESLTSSLGNLSGGFTNDILNYLKGNELNIPKVWGNSQKNFTYMFDVTLFCPYIRDDDVYNAMLGELGALLLLSVPLNDNTDNQNFVSFSSPFFVTGRVDGLCEIKLGMIKSISHSYGGIYTAMNQRSYMMNLKIIIDDVYDVLVGYKSGSATSAYSQSLKDYLNILAKETTTYADQVNPAPTKLLGEPGEPPKDKGYR